MAKDDRLKKLKQMQESIYEPDEWEILQTKYVEKFGDYPPWYVHHSGEEIEMLKRALKSGKKIPDTPPGGDVRDNQ